VIFLIKIRESIFNNKITTLLRVKLRRAQKGGGLVNKLAKIAYISLVAMVLLMPVLVLAQVGDPIVPPSGPTLTLDRIETLLRRIGTWLIMIAIVIAVIMIVVGGIRYMAGQEGAKDMIWNGIIGAAVVLAVGLILRTLAAVLTQTFFGV